MLISGLSLAQSHALLKMSSALGSTVPEIEGMQTGFVWRSLSEAEAEAQRATYLQAVRDNQFTAQQITRLFANPVMPM
jgi:hypothetical protein